MKVPYDTLKAIEIETSNQSCTKSVLCIIEAKNPHLIVTEMRKFFEEMKRADVCRVLDKFLSGINFDFSKQTSHF